ncbi:MAG: chromosome segregation protein SMC [Phycisphaerales bacterium]|nr:MAG: chromosome segregation protein SMC [Phycisphaerales bacterium]
MFLKRVSLLGFKSFADKVEFEFGPGVTCVVGPNGCGKSNIVDSFKWVLGEQSAKSLRGRQMQDMIFNGSASRRSTGMAQVDLVFDNADRMLPYDSDEVVVSRKLFRSGESEYSLCRQVVRLRDVRDLFLDTGIGTEAYSVIEQGKVELLLQSSPTDRRIVFEEAAGISKYRARKREAERKLDRTGQNLLRAEDIIGEVEKRLRSVKYQAGKARSYQTYQARLKELRAAYVMAEFHRHSQNLRNLTADADRASDEVTALRTGIDANESQASQLSIRADALAEELRVAESEAVKVQTEITAQQERIDGATQRIEEQQADRERALRQLESTRCRRQEITAELERSRQQVEVLSEKADGQRKEVERLLTEDRELAQEFTHVQALLEDEKAGTIELLRRTARLHNEIATLRTHRESLIGRQGELSQRDAAITIELKGLLEQKSDLERRLVEIDGLIEAETRRLEEKQLEARRIDATRARLADELAETKEARSGLASRRELLQDLERKMEGVGAGVRRLLEQKAATKDDEGSSRPQLDAVWGMVADAFDADVVHAAIIEAALGELDQFLVVSDSEAFLSDESLFDDLPGRLAAVCLDRLPALMNVRDFSGQLGFVAQAVDLVRFAEPVEPLARHLLAKTVVVQSLQDAISLSAQDTAGHRFVTLSGQAVEPDGCIRLGPPSSRSGLISRRSELRAIDEQIQAADARVAARTEQLSRTSAEWAHLDALQHELRTAIYESHTTKVETNAILKNVDERIRRLTHEQPLIAGQVASLQREIEEAAARSTQNEASLGHLETESQTRQREREKCKQRIDELADRRSALADALTRGRVAEAQLAEKHLAAVETIAVLQRNLREIDEVAQAAEAETRDCQARIDDSQAAIENCNARLRDLRSQSETFDRKTLELKRDREQLRARVEELAAATKKYRADLEEAEERLHQAQMRLNEARVRRDELTARVADELGLDLVQMYESYDHAEQDWQAVETEIADLKGKLERLGSVNLDAIAEQEELEQRHTFLTTQRDDLTRSQRQLERLIEQLNAESRRRFREAFEKIRENFRELFRRLFAGGKADIILEDPDHMLDCGIEIVARPPGKELQSISLLSGGEKAMTAIALLMAIFRSRPAPFAILDEVDATLDEANNDRFNNIVREFLDRSQFIIITHSKRTMALADRLYGVTMQEAGVSTLVGVNFERTEQTGQPAVA